MDTATFENREFRFPAEILLGRIEALHGDEFEQHRRTLRQARQEAAEFNAKFHASTSTTQHQRKIKK